MDKDEFLVQEGKTEKARKITINAFVKEALEFVADALTRQGKFHPDNFLFLNRRGQRLTIQYANQSLHQVFEEYGIRVQNGSSHTLRKTFGRRVWEMDNKSERSLIYLSEIFNHSSIAITKRYIGITEKTIADVYLKL